MTSQGLQFAEMGRWWRPGSGSLFFAEATDECCIRTIIFVAQQFALAESFDLCWIAHADRVSPLVQIKGQRFAIRTSGFQAGMYQGGFVFGQPNTKLSKSFFAIGEPTMA